MNNRFFVMLVIALVLAGAAAWMANDLVKNLTGQQVEANVVPVVAAAIEIPYGTKIDATHLKMLGWPKNHLPKGAFTDTKLVIGKLTQRAFVVDEALLEPQVKDKMIGTILSSLIPIGKRAMSVRVDAVVGVAGFIAPGSMVDIIASNHKTNSTYILLSNVKVLAIDQVVSRDQDKPTVVSALTLEVTAEESTTLVKAMRNGAFYFTLRNSQDQQNVATTVTKEVEVVETATEKQEQRFVKPAIVIRPKKPSLTIIDWPTSGKRQEEATREGAR